MDLAGSLGLVSFIYVVTPRPKAIVRMQTRLLPDSVDHVEVAFNVTVRPERLEFGVPLDGLGLVLSFFAFFLSRRSLLGGRLEEVFVSREPIVVVGLDREVKSCIRNDLV